MWVCEGGGGRSDSQLSSPSYATESTQRRHSRCDTDPSAVVCTCMERRCSSDSSPRFPNVIILTFLRQAQPCSDVEPSR